MQRDVGLSEKDLTREPETVKAFRDLWSLGVHSYLTYLKDRLVVARELLSEHGSLFLQIGQKNAHLAREVLDEVFGSENFVNHIAFLKTSGSTSKDLSSVFDHLLWYRKSEKMTYRPLFAIKRPGESGATGYRTVLLPSGELKSIGDFINKETGDLELPDHADLLSPGDYTSQSPGSRYDVNLCGRHYRPEPGYWKTDAQGMKRILSAERLLPGRKYPAYSRRITDFPAYPLDNVWTDTLGQNQFGGTKVYATQTALKVIERCLLMTTDPGDLVLDPTCGSGTTAFVSEQWGRRWISIDTSRVAISIARQRVLSASFENYELREEQAGPSKGFFLNTIPHIMPSSITQNTNLDPIFAKHESLLASQLKDCNRALAAVPDTLRIRLASKLRGKERGEGKRAVTDADRRRWLLPPDNRNRSAKARKLATVDLDATVWYGWEVPFNTDPDWPRELQEAVTSYRQAWRAKMEEVDACIAANADSEALVDKPRVVKGVLRVSGPFTMEGVFPEELNLGDKGLFDGTPNTFEEDDVEIANATQADSQNQSAYLARLIQLLRADGVTFPNNQQRDLTRIEPLFESTESGGSLIHAEGLWAGENEAEPNNIAIGFGPQYGPVTALQVEELVRSSRRYDELVIAGFSFDAAASAVIQESSHPRLRIHQAYIRPDAHPAMDGLLKDTPNSQLFTVFGQPDIEVRPDGDGKWICELLGVDIYDPLTSTVKSTGAAKVAAWFLDQDYDGRCFCITQAFFPDQKAWTKIAKALGSSADPEAFAAFEGTVSLPFPTGKHHRIAVKVIDPRGNEVMAIETLEA